MVLRARVAYVCLTPPEPGIAFAAPPLCPSLKQQLPLLGIEAHQRAHDFFLHEDPVRRIASVERAARAPLRVALLAQGQHVPQMPQRRQIYSASW